MDNLQVIINNIYNELKDNREGNVADYIPQLAKVDEDMFSISICDINGNIHNIGDYGEHFCVQSCSKPISYCIAREINNYNIHDHVGYEPSGQSFNAFILNKENLPHNPMINAGAMMVSSLIYPDKEPSARFEYIKDYYNKLSGNKGIIGFDNSTYLSEQHHADRNMSLAYYMRENNAYKDNITPSDLQNHLNLYFQSCSITINSEIGAIISSTLANGGICPVTNEYVFSKNITKDCLSLMYMCGMYDYSGQFAFKNGLPAKSGVSGCLLLVIPNICGICIWSPRLDSMGNSVKGVKFCELLNKYTDNKYHIFNIITENNITDEQIIKSCSNGDLMLLEKYKDNINYNICDYDKRYPIHLASSNGHLNIVEYILSYNINIEVEDRWGNTPLKEVQQIISNMDENDDKLQIYKSIETLLINYLDKSIKGELTEEKSIEKEQMKDKLTEEKTIED